MSGESRAVELARQRERLIARAEAQRHELAAHVRRWEVPLRVADKALAGARLLARLEGIIPALETAHALAYLDRLMPETRPDEINVVNISGRGDKDIAALTAHD